MMKFVKEEEGSILEYLILIAIVAVIAAILFPNLRTNVMAWFNNMLGNVKSGIGGGGTNMNTSLTNSSYNSAQ